MKKNNIHIYIFLCATKHTKMHTIFFSSFVEMIAMEFDMTPISFHPAVTTIPTYKRGSKQIDTIMVSDNLLPHVRQQNMLAYDSVCLSDHRTMYIDIDIKKYIRMNIKINKHIPQGITSKHPDQI